MKKHYKDWIEENCFECIHDIESGNKDFKTCAKDMTDKLFNLWLEQENEPKIPPQFIMAHNCKYFKRLSDKELKIKEIKSEEENLKFEKEMEEWDKPKTLTYYLPEEYKKLLKDVNKTSGLLISDIVRSAISKTIEQNKKILEEFLYLDPLKKTEKMSIVLPAVYVDYLKALAYIKRDNISKVVSDLVMEYLEQMTKEVKSYIKTSSKH